MKIVVDCIHNAGRTVPSSARRQEIAYRIASSVCKQLNEMKNCSASMPESVCLNKFGTDSIRGRISVAVSQNPDCYICFHSNPSIRCRENGIAAFVRRGDRRAIKISEVIMNNVSGEGKIKNLGIFENTNSSILKEASDCSPIILELLYNPYGEGYSSFRKKLEFLPSDVVAGVEEAFSIAQDITDAVFTEFLGDNSGNGYLKVQVVAGRSLVPITDAKIVVTKNLNGNDYVVADVVSDMNGMTAPISLPAPPSQLSQTPDDPVPYAVYDVKISRDGYQTINNLNVPVFDKVTSIQTARLNSAAINGEDEINDETGSQKL